MFKSQNYFFAGLALLLAPFCSISQSLEQSVKGVVREVATGRFVPQAEVQLLRGADAVAFTVSDSVGGFTLSALPGRYRLLITHVGFQQLDSELLVISGKESQLDLALTESATVLQNVEVSAASYSREAPGSIAIPIEKTLRVPANFFDPVRMATSYPGVVAANDQGNSIVVKGYSPNALLWRLEGLDVVNPNHLANAGTLSDKPAANGGGVSVLSAQVLDRTDFYTGWLPAQYGNALSGAIDMKLRDGNKSKMEFTGQASLIGLDIAAEGPLSASGKNSFLANYRYSTVGLLSALGLDFGDEQIDFQDITYHFDFDQRNGANLSVFGFGGFSENHFNRKPQDEWEEEKDRYDIDFTGDVFGIGFTEEWGNKIRWRLGSVFSGQVQERKSQSETVSYTHIFRENYNNRRFLLSNSLTATGGVGGGILQGGLMMNRLENSLDVETVSQLYFDSFYPNMSGSVNGNLWQPFVNCSRDFGKWHAETGLRYVFFDYNNSDAIEPRAVIQRNFRSGSLSFSYGRVSQWQQVQTYLANNNQNLGLTKAEQYLLELRQGLGGQMNLTASVYYQKQSDVPVTNGTEFFSALNQYEDFPLVDLFNTGKGSNAGVEAGLEKRFYNQFYFMVNGSYFNSTYSGFDDTDFSTRFNGKFTSSAMAGKEWTTEKKSFGVHARFLYSGGMRQPRINLTNSAFYGTTVYDYSNGYPVKLPDYLRTDLRVSWRKNKPGYTRTLSIDIQNLFNRLNVASYYYDTFTQQIETKTQLGIIPVLVYRVDF